MIGKKIRDIRKSKSMTIVELSEQIDVTSGYISQIERDLISPSLSVLKRLSQALEIPLSVLFLDDTHENVLTVTKGSRTKVKFGNINVELEFITPIMKNNEKSDNYFGAEIFIFKLPPKTWVSDEAMIHESKVCLYVLKGKFECHIGGKIYSVLDGDSICIPENNGHLIYNSNDEVTEVITFLTPSHFS